jgi:ABC-2 type transport system ATP-binding protein
MLKIENLRKNYAGFDLDCSLEVRSGCITGLVGQNGAGKSTIFKSVLGLISIGGGKISLLGKDASNIEPADKEKIGVVFSDSGFSGYLSIKDIVPIMRAMYAGFEEDYFIDQVSRLGLPMDKKIKDFSTGMKAKLKVIAATSHKSKILLLDEPASGLDVIARNELFDILRDYMEEDAERAILISSHISGDLEALCDDIYMIDNGKMILHEDTDVLLDDYALLKIDDSQYENIDRRYILRVRKEAYGYNCLTNAKQYYIENYPQIAIEKGSIDNVITLMVKGEKV